MPHHFNSAQNTRENLLAQLKTMNEEKISVLKNELAHEHQKLISALSTAQTDEQEKYAILLKQNERQMQIVNHYPYSRYKKIARSEAPSKPIAKNTLRAFLTGGIICTIAQTMINLLTLYTALDAKTISALGSVSIIILTAVLTGFGIYDEIGRFGGAGSMVPISGFANSIVSAALEFKREGMVYGIGAKIFTVAGPVILYGTLSSVIIGLISYIGGYYG